LLDYLYAQVQAVVLTYQGTSIDDVMNWPEYEREKWYDLASARNEMLEKEYKKASSGIRKPRRR